MVAKETARVFVMNQEPVPDAMENVLLSAAIVRGQAGTHEILTSIDLDTDEILFSICNYSDRPYLICITCK